MSDGGQTAGEDAGARIRALRVRIARLDDDALDLVLREARTFGAWQDRPVTDDDLRAVYQLAKWGPTNANSAPARFVFVRSDAEKKRLLACVGANNVEKVRTAPVTAIIAHDLEFWTLLPRLFPERDLTGSYRDNPAHAELQAVRNAALQGAYFILAARALGFDTGALSGFRADEVDAAFFAGTPWRANFMCNIGYGDETRVKPRGPRLAFEEACRIV